MFPFHPLALTPFLNWQAIPKWSKLSLAKARRLLFDRSYFLVQVVSWLVGCSLQAGCPLVSRIPYPWGTSHSLASRPFLNKQVSFPWQSVHPLVSRQPLLYLDREPFLGELCHEVHAIHLWFKGTFEKKDSSSTSHLLEWWGALKGLLELMRKYWDLNL